MTISCSCSTHITSVSSSSCRTTRRSLERARGHPRPGRNAGTGILSSRGGVSARRPFPRTVALRALAMSAELDRLCARCGVELEYWDLWGNRRHASDSTKLRLLQAMGVPIDAAENAGAALAALEQAAWREVLAPVKVARAGAPVRSGDRRSRRPRGERIRLDPRARKRGTHCRHAAAGCAARSRAGGNRRRSARPREFPADSPPALRVSPLHAARRGEAGRHDTDSSSARVAATSRQFSPMAGACGARRSSSTPCVRNATGASATSATWSRSRHSLPARARGSWG